MQVQSSQSRDEELILAQVVTEYFERLSQGESPQVEEYVERYPEIADVLRKTLPALLVVNDSVSGLPIGNPTSGPEHEKVIGDFRILHELGRGGMGVVYEAEQISMGGRRVALKVMPFAAMADPRHLQRFHNEVRAAGSLDHPNIVSVYTVGQDRGVHFYAMRLILGKSMAGLIQELGEVRQHVPLSAASVKQALSSSSLPSLSSGSTDPTQSFDLQADVPSEKQHTAENADTANHPQAMISTKGSGKRSDYYEAIADLGIQAAEALEHAHERGVIHRDIKPANLMIDAYSQLYITDFGLAHIEEAVGMTMTGDLIGTLRYMSPEQAMGKRVVIDYRTDIYSLGVTLYELLTTEPVFDGENRAALLKQVAFDEPRKLTQIDPSIPRDLETIVHKAMEKNPDDRYSSAQELADDLRAFRAYQPIGAKPPSVIDRLRKYTRRNQGIVAAATIILLLTTIGLAVSNSMIMSERRETERRRADAEENLQLARETLDTYLEIVSEDDLLETPSMQPLRRRFLELALEYYNRMLEKHSDSAKLESEAARAHYQVGNIALALRDAELAEDSHRKALDIRKRLFRSNPDDEEIQVALGESYNRVVWHGGLTDDEAIFLSQEAIGVLQPLTKTDQRLMLARMYFALAIFNANKKRQHSAGDDARAYAVRILKELIESEQQDPECQSLLAKIYAFDPKEGDVGVEILETLAAKHPDDREIKKSLVVAYLNLDAVVNRPDLLERSLKVLHKLAEAKPEDASTKLVVCEVLDRQASNYEPSSMWQPTLEKRQAQLEILNALASKYPNDDRIQNRLTRVHAAMGRAQLGLANYEDAIESLTKSMARWNESSFEPYTLADVLLWIGEAQKGLGLPEDATKSVLDAQKAFHPPKWLDKTGSVTAFSQKCEPFALWLKDTGQASNAIRVAQGRMEILACARGIVQDTMGAAKHLNLLNECSQQLEAVQLESLLSQQLEAWESLPDQGDLIRMLQFDLCLRLGSLHDDAGRSTESEAHFRKARSLLESVKDEPFLLVFLELHVPSISIRSGDVLDERQVQNRQALDRILEVGLALAREQARRKANVLSYATWSRFAIAYYHGRDWRGAEKEARLAAAWAADHPENHVHLSTLLLLAGEVDEYHRLCLELLGRWQEWEREDVAQASELCGIDPTETNDPDSLMRLAQRAVVVGPEWTIVPAARSQYRAGQASEAVGRFEEFIEFNEDQPFLFNYYDLAIANQKAGNQAEALVAFEAAEKLAEIWASDWPRDWLFSKVLRKEAIERLGITGAQSGHDDAQQARRADR